MLIYNLQFSIQIYNSSFASDTLDQSSREGFSCFPTVFAFRFLSAAFSVDFSRAFRYLSAVLLDSFQQYFSVAFQQLFLLSFSRAFRFLSTVLFCCLSAAFSVDFHQCFC